MAELTRSAIEIVLHEYCQTGSGVQFIILNSSTDGPRPSNTYGTLQLSSFVSTYTNAVTYEDNLGGTLDEIVRILPTVTVSVNIFGNDAEDKMLKLRAFCSASESIQLLEKNKMGFISMSQMNDLDILTHKTWEHRFQTDFKIGLSGEYIFDVDPVEEVVIHNDLYDNDIIIP